MLKEKVSTLRYTLQKCQKNKLFRNFGVCGFIILYPRNTETSIITFNGEIVGSVKDGIIIVDKYNPDVFKTEQYKFDILCTLAEELNPNEEEEF